MRKNNFFQFIVCLFSVVLLMSSCIKESKDELGNAGKTIVKFLPTGTSVTAFKPIAELQTGQLFEVRRDPNSSSDLNSATTVTIKWEADSTLLAAYNQDIIDAWVAAIVAKYPDSVPDPASDFDGVQYTRLPSSFYTLDPAPNADSLITISFAAGEISKRVMITVPDPSQFDFGLKYIIPFKLMTVTGAGVKTGVNDGVIFSNILALNKYDGLYSLKGVHNRVPYNFPYRTDIQLRTTGANTVIFYWPSGGDYGHPIGTATGLSWYGSGIAPNIEFDPITNKVIDVWNTGSVTPITLFTTGAGSLPNEYYPATKTLLVSWNYNHNLLRVFSDTLVFKSER